MANEIQVATRPDKSIYATVHDTSGNVWSTSSSSFVTYATADLANYVISLTEQGTGSGYYVGTFPSAISEGAFNVAGYMQSGGSAAEGDVLVGSGPVEWTGSVIGPFLPTGTKQGIADEVLDRTDGVESGFTLRQSLRLILSSLAGKLSGASGTTISIRDVNDSKDRLVATVDADGNRTALTLDKT